MEKKRVATPVAACGGWGLGWDSVKVALHNAVLFALAQAEGYAALLRESE